MKRLVFLLFLAHVTVFGQLKFEKEYRVDNTKVPKQSKHIVKIWGFKEKIKWYVEESQDGKTFEAKVCYKKRKHSIEFSEKGEIIDVEINVKFSELDKEVQYNIIKTMGERFKKFKIKKTQIQYTGDESTIYTAVFDLETHHEKQLPLYELIVKGKAKNNYVEYEFLFDSKGNIMKELQFAPQNTDNLEF